MAAVTEVEHDADTHTHSQHDLTSEKCVRDDVISEEDSKARCTSVLGRDKRSFRNFPGFVDMSSPTSSSASHKMDSNYSPGKTQKDPFYHVS